MKAIILATNKGLYRNVIECLVSSGIKENITIGTSELKYVSASKYCKQFYEIPFDTFVTSPKVIMDLIAEIVKKEGFLILIPACMPSTYFASTYKTKLQAILHLIPISDIEPITELHNKWRIYLLAKLIDINVPNTYLLNSKENVIDILDSEFPGIIKPLEQEGGKGHVRIESKYELLSYMNSYEGTTVIYQEFIPGYDVDLSVVCQNGEIKAWTMQRPTQLGIEFINNGRVYEIGEKIVREKNLTGILHFDLRISEKDNKVYLIECNPRVYGSMHCSCSVNVNFIELALKVLNNEGFSFRELKEGARYIYRKKMLKNLKDIELNDLLQMITQDLWYAIRDPFYYLLHSLGGKNPVSKFGFLKEKKNYV